MKFKALSVVLFALAALPMSAMTVTLTATPLDAEISSFTIEFTDLNSNNLFSLPELTSFSGVTVFTNFRNGVFSVPSIPGITCTSCSLIGVGGVHHAPC